MKIALITLTRGSLDTAKRIKDYYPDAQIYTKTVLCDESCSDIGKDFTAGVGSLFASCQALVFIMAAGIVVRSIAPFLQHKSHDPAVVVMDEKGRFAISLLSGHLGQANKLAQDLADCMGGTPVITTATDVNDLVAVDMLAERMGCAIGDFEAAKTITAMMLEGKTIGCLVEQGVAEEAGNRLQIEISQRRQILYKDIIGDIAASGQKLIWFEENQRHEAQAETDPKAHGFQASEKIDAWIIISMDPPKPTTQPSIWLVPKMLSLGIGCRRGKSFEELYEFAHRKASSLGVPLQSIGKIGTALIKSDEAGILQLGKALHADMHFYPNEDIQNVESKFEGSQFVLETLGVTGVSEPCGYLVSNRGKCLHTVVKENGMTLSIWLDREA